MAKVLDKTEEETKVQRLKEGMIRADNAQPFRQAKYNLCKIQLKWELAWTQLSEKDKNFYEWTLKDKFDEALGENKHDQCMAFIPQKIIDKIAKKLGVKTFKRSKKHREFDLKYPNGYEDGEGYSAADDSFVDKEEKQIAIKEFLPLIQNCDTKKTTYEKKKCKESIPTATEYLIEGVVSNIISEQKFILRLASDQYANIYGNFSPDSMEKLISLSNTGAKISFIGSLKSLGTGLVFKHDFNYIRPL